MKRLSDPQYAFARMAYMFLAMAFVLGMLVEAAFPYPWNALPLAVIVIVGFWFVSGRPITGIKIRVYSWTEKPGDDVSRETEDE